MQAVAFDTLKFAQKLRDKAKFSPEQAEQMALAYAESFSEWQDQAKPATQDDIEKLRLELSGKIESTVAEAKADILKWMFTAIGLQTLVILGALIGLLHNIGKV